MVLDKKVASVVLNMLKAVADASKYLVEIQSEITKIERKDDNSPVTIADRKSEEIIETYLSSSGIPFLGEESFKANNIPHDGEFFLADPLDGTREFIKPSDEFAINLCWLKNFQPYIGIIAIPKKEIVYLGIIGKGLYIIPTSKIKSLENLQALEIFRHETSNAENKKTEVETILISHWEKEKNIEILKGKFPKAKLVKLGSAIKFCEIANRNADLYLRFSTVMEWDLAAGHALIKAAGGKVYPFLDTPEISYGKTAPYSGKFITTSKYIDMNIILEKF